MQVRESQLLELLGMTVTGLRPSRPVAAVGRQVSSRSSRPAEGGATVPPMGVPRGGGGRGRASCRPRDPGTAGRQRSSVIRPAAPGLGPPKSGAGWALEPFGGLQVSAGATGRSGPGRSEGTGPGEGVQCREERVRSREGRAPAPRRCPCG